MKKIINVIAVVLGILCVGLAFFYWTTPADHLPMLLPGYNAAMTGVHVKHGVAAIVVGLALLIFAWFNSAKKAS